MSNETSIRRFVVRGRVQGVGFRAFVEETALVHGLEGWVRNRRDGSVEGLFAGVPEAVAMAMEACRQGPRSARVEALDELETGPQALSERRPGERFSVLATL